VAWREWLRETVDTPWPPVGGAAVLGAAFAILWILVQASTGDRWVPILDHANLAFHEAGHPIVGLISQRLAVYGGTLGQLAFPVATTIAFWSRRHSLGFAFCFAWTCQNLLNIATYMGDARAMELPLVGGLDPQDAHDWHEIFSRWGMLDTDTAWAGLNRLVAWAGGIWICLWLMRRWRDGREA
jgi:hypothetical protein